MKSLLSGKDVFAVQSTEFGKSLIFTFFAFASQELIKRTRNTGYVCFGSLTVRKLDRKSNSGTTLNGLHHRRAKSAIVAFPPQFIYCTAEKVLGEKPRLCER